MIARVLGAVRNEARGRPQIDRQWSSTNDPMEWTGLSKHSDGWRRSGADPLWRRTRVAVEDDGRRNLGVTGPRT